MSFKTAKDHFEAAAEQASDPGVEELSKGLIELTKVLQREIADMASRLRTMESKINHLR